MPYYGSFICETEAFYLFSLTDLSVLVATGLIRGCFSARFSVLKWVSFIGVCFGEVLKTVPSLLNVFPSVCRILTCSIVVIVTRSFKIKWASVNFKILIYYSIMAPHVGSEWPYRCV